MRPFRLSIKWLKRASSKEIPCLNKFYKIYNKHSISLSSPQKSSRFSRTPELNEPFLPHLQRETGATCCTRSDCKKTAWTSSSSRFWRFSSFARGQYRRTAPARKIQNLSHFLNVYQRVEIYYLTFSTRCKVARGATFFFYKIMHISPLQPSFITLSIVSLNLFLASIGIR